ncbi:alpha/beta hydrolase-fold protein [Tumebacillus flagellatus]|uniref:Enterochelin esterase N-terminal domain-containing protein n=1 Tax=Tumebacillus flagellatus TaxID=1157490 RepID=A0A074LJC3_9BACL|nr:alpha/beta hydrolase-fold protein [Tumebacillus flagellatus]KEO82281.1 hypothetical protein EL26_15980 [Tumebacillus flagellatus]
MIDTHRSPALAELATELASLEGNQRRTRVEQFWQEIAACGTPLWERDEQGLLVTFLWRSLHDDRVVVLGGPAGFDAAQNKLERLEDTDIWFKTCPAEECLASMYMFVPHHEEGWDWTTRRNACVRDPLNPHSFEVAPHQDLLPLTGYSGSVLMPHGAKRSPVLTRQTNTPQGTTTEHRFASKRLGNERSVYVHTPPGYTADGEPYQLLLMFDGIAYDTLIPSPVILDNLLREGAISPTVTVLINNLHLTRNEELRCNDEFVRFVTEEVLPWVRGNWHVTDDPARTIIGGASNGGLCSLYAALKHPELFGGVLAQSGNFGWSPEGSAPAPVLQEVLTRTDLTLRCSLDAGTLEPAILEPNRTLVSLLRERGAQVLYREFVGTHDFLCWAEMFAGAAKALLR